jgi:PilZ domain
MESNPKFGEGPSSFEGNVERRVKPRIYESFPLKVRGIDEKGQPFQTDSVLDNLSAGGLYVRLSQRVIRGARLFMVVQFSALSSARLTSARVAAKGVVTRAELLADGKYGLGIEFKQHRFL